MGAPRDRVDPNEVEAAISPREAVAADEESQPLIGSRVRRLRASRSYGFVLVLVLTAFSFTASAPDEPWPVAVLIMLQAATLLAAIWTSGLTGRVNVIAGVLVAVGGVLAIAQIVGSTDVWTGMTNLFAVILTAGSVAVIGLGVLDQNAINRQSILGALCVYLLIGMLFTFAYGVVAAFDSDPFFAQGTDGSNAVRLYFSFVTMTTVGYGDYTAAGSVGRTMAITEALLGQVYLVTVLAFLVSRVQPFRRDR
jgi:hypothetical protein